MKANDYIHEVTRTQGALAEIIRPKCAECGESLTDEEIAEATRHELKNPACTDCYMDFSSDRYEEGKHPDERP